MEKQDGPYQRHPRRQHADRRGVEGQVPGHRRRREVDGRDADGVQQMRQGKGQQHRRSADGPHGVLVPPHDVPPHPPPEPRDVAAFPDVPPEEVQAGDRGKGGQFRQHGRRGEGALDLHEPRGLDVGVLEGPAADGHEDRVQDADQDGAQDEHRRQGEDGEVVAGLGPGPGIGGELRQGGGVRFPRGDLEVGRHFGYLPDGLVDDVGRIGFHGGFHGVLLVWLVLKSSQSVVGYE